MRYRPVYNKRLDQWVICHDQWCERGETSIVHRVLTSLDPEADAREAQAYCDRFNAMFEAAELIALK